MEDNIDFSKKTVKINNNLPNDLSSEIEGLYDYFEKNNITYEKFTTRAHKVAYPNYEHAMSLPGTHNVEKWMSALREILYLEKKGKGRVDSIKKVTSDWKEMEVFDFLNWIKFYENNDHLKYSKAQYVPNYIPNYFLSLKEKGELNDKNDIDFAMSNSANRISLSEKKKIIERQRNKIISRLDSAEKLLRTEEGELFAGNDLESLIQAIYTLKTKIQLVNKVSLATKLYEDMIVRQANILDNNGFKKGANVLMLIAKGTNISEIEGAPSAPASPAPHTITNTSPQIPATDPGSVNRLNELEGNNLPDMSVQVDIPEIEEDESAGIIGFLNNLNNGGLTTSDTLEASDDLFVSEAQMLPQQNRPNNVSPLDGKTPRKETTVTNPSKNIDLNKEKNLEVSEEDSLTPSSSSRIDKMVDSLFNNVTIEDVIGKLEELSKVFNTREIPRQLALLDMMLDSLGLATYFPSLPEATNKALDSNNYIATRIDDILSKLRGNMGHDLDLSGDNNKPQSPEVQSIMNNLENDKQKDERRKEMRKEKENKALEDSLKPEPELDLGDLEVEESPDISDTPETSEQPLSSNTRPLNTRPLNTSTLPKTQPS